MGTEIVSFESLQNMANAVAKSKLWKTVDTPEKAMALMMLCQSEGLHPMTAVRRYDIIQGTPTLKAEAQLAEFYARGGSVKWIQRTAEVCEAKFSHPKNCPDGVVIKWTLEDARRAGLLNKDNWKNYPRQMLSSRVSSEGVQVTDPGAGLGMLTQEEAIDVQNNLADQAAAFASSFTGDKFESLPALPEVAQAEDKDFRKMRADLNKALQGCKTEAEFKTACKAFQAEHTKAIWVQLTRHNEIETFAMLAEAHQSRLTSAEHFISPEGQAEWREKLSKCDGEKEFRQYEGTLLAYPEYSTHENQEAVALRGRELGLEEYHID